MNIECCNLGINKFTIKIYIRYTISIHTLYDVQCMYNVRRTMYVVHLYRIFDCLNYITILGFYPLTWYPDWGQNSTGTRSETENTYSKWSPPLNRSYDRGQRKSRWRCANDTCVKQWRSRLTIETWRNNLVIGCYVNITEYIDLTTSNVIISLIVLIYKLYLCIMISGVIYTMVMRVHGIGGRVKQINQYTE